MMMEKQFIGIISIFGLQIARQDSNEEETMEMKNKLDFLY